MKKKLVTVIISIIVVAAVAVSLAVLLINQGKQTSDEEEFIPSGSQVDVSNLKDAKISIYIEARTSNAMTDVLQAVNEKLRSEIKTELSFELVAENPDSYYAKIQKTIAAGTPCDAFFFASYFPASLGTLVKEGLAGDLTNDFPKYAPNYFGSFSGEDLEAISVSGKIYAIPYRIPTAEKKSVFVRSDLMAKYNIPEIKSYDDYEVYLTAVKKNEPDLIPMNYWDTTIGLFSEVNGYAILDYEMGLVYKWNDPSMKVMAWEQTPGFEDGINKIKSWYDKEFLLKNIGIANIDENMITSGKWASFIGNWGNEFEYNALLAGNGKTDYKYVAYPLNNGYSPRNSPLESALVINAKSKQADRVLMFINWLQSKQENYDLLMYGVKDKHYTEMEDYIVPAEGVEIRDSFFQWGWRAPFRNIEFERANFSGLKEDVSRYRKLIEEKTKYPPHMGFRPDYSSLTDSVTMRRMGFSSLDQKVYQGTFGQSDVDDFIKEQKDIGIQNMVDEIQKQLDKFKKGQ